MPKRITVWISSFSVLIALSLLPVFAESTTLTVSKSCDSPTNCYGTISDALSAPTPTTGVVDIIVVETGEYTESDITLRDNITIRGNETARTIIRHTGTGALFNATGLSNVHISRLTIANGSTGVLAANSSNINISNNIFWDNDIAIQFTGTSSGDISNNTFFENQTAISSTVDVLVTHNIFSGNNTALSAVNPLAAFTRTNTIYNLFHNNVNTGSFTIDSSDPEETNIPSNNTGRTNADPKFVKSSVEPPDMDLHLREGSGAIGTGSSDGEIGAFGGSGADTIPFPVSGISAVFQIPSSVKVSWSPNNAYNIGSHNVYYKSGSGSDTKVNVPSPATSTIISGLTGTAAPPGTPVLNQPEYADRKLILSWWPVANAAGYKVYVFDSKTAIESAIDVGPIVFYIVDGLVNGREYGVTISAYSQTAYDFSVTAVDNSTAAKSPGVAHESARSTNVRVYVGDAVEGLRSSPTQTAYPDRIVGGPDLPDKGCFIATAAYGYYSAPQVQVLRTFRDRYLATNRPGRAFVDWYYRYGPKGAEFMNAHPWLKPVVRTVLLPLVGGAWFLTEAAMPVKITAALFAGMIIFVMMTRKKLSSSGGVR